VFHAGTVLAEIASAPGEPYALDTPELAGAVPVWLSTPEARFLNKRVTAVN
jgi:hypothetical protein